MGDDALSPGWKCLTTSGNVPALASSCFHNTLCHIHLRKAKRLRTYGSLFTDDPVEHIAPYTDVYTRYLTSIFDTAQSSGNDGPSDTLFVCHVGPFWKYLDEEMNCDYFFSQLKAVREGCVRIVRLWLDPVLHIRRRRSSPQLQNRLEMGDLPPHVLDRIDSFNAGLPEGAQILPNGDFQRDASGLAVAGPFFNCDEDYPQDRRYRCFVLTRVFAKMLKNENDSKWTSPRVKGLGLVPSRRESVKNYFFSKENDALRRAICDTGSSKRKSLYKAFCKRGEELLMFKYADSRENGLTMAQVVRSHTTDVEGQFDGDWSLYNIISRLDHDYTSFTSKLCPMKESALESWAVPETQSVDM